MAEQIGTRCNIPQKPQVVKMRRVGRQRLWTLISVVPIAVLCAVLVYGYAIRPRLAVRRSRADLGPTVVWEREAGRIRPWLLDLLSDQQRTEVEENKAKYETDLQDLPSGIRKQIKRIAEADKIAAGRRLAKGKITYEPDGERPGEIVVSGEFRLPGKKPGMGTSASNTAFPVAVGQPSERRFKPRPKIMRRTATVIVDTSVSVEEFNAWWEWTEMTVAPLAGPRQQDSSGQVVAYIRYGSLVASDLARVRDYFEYLLKVLPRPEPSEPVALGEMRDAGGNVYYTGLAPGDRVRRVTLGGTLSAPKGVPASGFLRYDCQAVGGLLWFSWDPAQDGTEVTLITERSKWQ